MSPRAAWGRAPLVAAALAGAMLALAVEWLYISGRLAWSPGEVPGFRNGLSREEIGLFALTLLIAGTVFCALIRQGRRDLAVKDAEIAQVSWRLNLALEASGIGFWDVDLATDIMSWDGRARELFGASPRDGWFGESDWANALHPEDRDAAVAAANRAAEAGERFVFDYRVVLPDGRIRHVRDMAMSYVAPDGSRRLSGLVWDVTADKLREAELEMRRREAESATVAKSNFLAAMSHEIRTPLTGLIGMLDLMLGEDLPPKQAERARVASSSAQSLLQVLNQVLDFSKLEANAVTLYPAPVSPRALVGEVTDLISARAGQKGFPLTCSLAPTVPDRVSVDPVRLRQVLTNIVSNAVAFTEAGHVAVRVDYDAPAETLAIAVEDTGIGIPEAERERIFERFVQADGSASRRAGGTGLGLAIARQLVEAMGGRIAVESAVGRGSTFRVTVKAPPAAPLPAAEAPEARRAPPPLRILVAEDNPTNQYLVQALLAADGHRVTLVPDGPSAVLAARTGSYDLVLMDVQMPGMDGPTAARAIRALPAPASEVPILALTASVLHGDAERYAAAGMAGYIAKPIDRTALSEALARAVLPPATPERLGT